MATARSTAAVAAVAATGAVALLLVVMCIPATDAQAVVSSSDPLLVHVPGQGAARGTEVRTYRGRRVRAWRGLPYAQPPTGARRFRPPEQPPPAWNGTRDAAAEPPACPQMVLLTREYAGQEDCLFLNVYSPYGAPGLPVLVWMHGGSFVEGHGGARWSGPDYLLEQPLVFVTFNYRLGPLGFLSTGDSIAQGNYGLKDAAAALRWVRANAAAFGGDPSRVTLWGYSAGAAAVHLLTLSPPARGLFDAAIFGSGGATHRWAMYSKPLETARRLGELVNCTTDPAAGNETQQLVTCLRERSAEEIVRTYYSFPSLVGDMPMPWGPVVEEDPAADDPPFLPRPPVQLLAESSVADVPVVTGMVADEAVDAAWSIFTDPLVAHQLDLNFAQVLGGYAPLPALTQEAADEIRRFYFGTLPLTEAPLENLTALFTDMFFTVESVGGAVAHARASSRPVYFYLFHLQGRVSELVRSGLAAQPHGIMHADDLLYILGRQYPFPPDSDWPNATESLAIQRLAHLWANVAAFGEPAPLGINDTLLRSTWGPVKGDGPLFQYLEFNAELRDVQGPPFADRIALWERLAKEAEAAQRTTAAPPPTPSPAPPLSTASGGTVPASIPAPTLAPATGTRQQPTSARGGATTAAAAPALLATVLIAALVAAAASLAASSIGFRSAL